MDADRETERGKIKLKSTAEKKKEKMMKRDEIYTEEGEQEKCQKPTWRVGRPFRPSGDASAALSALLLLPLVALQVVAGPLDVGGREEVNWTVTWQKCFPGAKTTARR